VFQLESIHNRECKSAQSLIPSSTGLSGIQFSTQDALPKYQNNENDILHCMLYDEIKYVREQINDKLTHIFEIFYLVSLV
jgi:hypothetical protein